MGVGPIFSPRFSPLPNQKLRPQASEPVGFSPSGVDPLKRCQDMVTVGPSSSPHCCPPRSGAPPPPPCPREGSETFKTTRDAGENLQLTIHRQRPNFGTKAVPFILCLGGQWAIKNKGQPVRETLTWSQEEESAHFSQIWGLLLPPCF